MIRLFRKFLQSCIFPLSALFWFHTNSTAQDDPDLSPVSSTYAITNATVIQGPGRRLDQATVIVRDGVIVSVAKNASIPADAIIVKADSMFVYAGFVDGFSRAGVTKAKEEKNDPVKYPGNPPPERAGITPHVDVRNYLNPADRSVEELRNLGFTVAQVVPHGNLLPGQAAIVLLSGRTADEMVMVKNSALYSELTGASRMYPNTIMAIMAKWRELYTQASQAKSYQAVYASNPSGLERPGSDRVLEAFYPVIDQRQSVLLRAQGVLEIQRVITLKKDLGFQLIMGDLKEGWPILDKIKNSGAKIFVSLDLPDAMKKEDKENKDKPESPELVKEKEDLKKRKAEAITNYESQAASLTKAGIQFGFSSQSAKAKDIQSNLRRMIAAGLSEDAALSALTTTPARLLGLSDRIGTVDNGKMANLVISDKPYFNEKAKVKYVFVDGEMFKVDAREAKKSDGKKAAIGGSWSYTTETPQGTNDGKLVIKDDGGNYSGTITNSFSDQPSDLTDVALDGNSLSFSYTIDAGGNQIKIDVVVTVEGDSFEGSMTAGQFGSFPITATKDPKN
jgi:imidazolonepropionase-like amidohydrolase